jgi:bHLH factor
MTVPDSDAAQAAQAFLDNTVSIAQAAHDHVNVDDFSALAQATAADHNDASDTANASNTAAAALNMYPVLHVPQSTEEAFANQATPETHHEDTTFSNHGVNQSPDGLPMVPSAPLPPPPNGVQQEQGYSAPSNPKPAVGSEEWHKMRKDNHKEGEFYSPHLLLDPYSNTFAVERRRRETINEGINELAKIVPGCEKNKGSILQRAVAFITQLKENETQNIEKWTLEKLLTEQAIAELSQSNDKLKQECERLYRELDTWKQMAQNAGLQLPTQKEEPGANS